MAKAGSGQTPDLSALAAKPAAHDEISVQDQAETVGGVQRFLGFDNEQAMQHAADFGHEQAGQQVTFFEDKFLAILDCAAQRAVLEAFEAIDADQFVEICSRGAVIFHGNLASPVALFTAMEKAS
jgi:hypothetical protein